MLIYAFAILIIYVVSKNSIYVMFYKYFSYSIQVAKASVRKRFRERIREKFRNSNLLIDIVGFIVVAKFIRVRRRIFKIRESLLGQFVSLCLVKEGNERKDDKDTDIHFCSFSPANITMHAATPRLYFPNVDLIASLSKRRF